MAKKITQKTKTPMPLQDPLERARNFEEVSLGYPVDLAVLEAQRVFWKFLGAVVLLIAGAIALILVAATVIGLLAAD